MIKAKSAENASREPVQQPRTFDVRETDTELVISWRWFDRSTLALLWFCLIWLGPMLILDFALLSRREATAANPMLVISIILTLTGFVALYTVVAWLLNTTTITVSESQIKTRTGPIPVAYGNRVFEAMDIEQIYVRERTINSKQRTYYSYDVMVLFHGSRKPYHLHSGLENREYAYYLEQEIELYLGIRDRQVVEDSLYSRKLK
jgi:hypothetical protein